MAYRFSPFSQFILPVQQPVAAVPGDFAQNAIMREQLAESRRKALETEQLALRQQGESERAASVAEGLARQQEMRERQKQDTEAFLKFRQLLMMGELPAAEIAARAGGLQIDKKMVPSEQERESWAGSMAGQMLGAPVPPVSIEPPQEQWSISRGGERLGTLSPGGGVEKGIDEAYALFDKAVASRPSPLPPGTENVVRMYREMAPDAVRAFNRSGGSAKDAIELLMDRMGAHLNTLGNVRRGGGGGGGGVANKDVKWIGTHVRGLVKDYRLRVSATKIEEKLQMNESVQALIQSNNPLAHRAAIGNTIKEITGSQPSNSERINVEGAGGMYNRLKTISNNLLSRGESTEEYRAMMSEASGILNKLLNAEKKVIVDRTAGIIRGNWAIKELLKNNPEAIEELAWDAALQAGAAEDGKPADEEEEAEPGADVLDLMPDE